MRLFLIGWELPEAAAALAKRGHEIAYWTGAVFTKELMIKFPRTIFHDFYQAYDGVPAPGVDTARFDPPSEDLLRKFATMETTVLPMMTKRFDWMPLGERKHFYYELLRYWNGVMKTIRPASVIFPGPPHAVYDFIVYQLARFFKIPTIVFYETLVKGRSLILDDVLSRGSALEQRPANIPIGVLPDLAADLRGILEQQSDPAVDKRPGYFKQGLARYSRSKVLGLKIKMVANGVRHGTIVAQAGRYLAKMFKPNLKNQYRRLAAAADPGKKFIYVPLHYQPECSTVTLGGVYDDQILMIETLAASLPSDWVIYVKEHPGQWLPRGYNFFGYRYERYYQAIARIKNVSLIPIDTDTFLLIQKAQAVATVTGTAGWEAVLRQKPALVFGFAWYRDCPGVKLVDGTESCRRAIEGIANGTASPTKTEIVNFLRAFDRAAIRAYFSPYGQAIAGISAADNISNIVKAIEERLPQKYE